MEKIATYRRKFLFYILLVALIGIWMRVIFSVYQQVEGGEVSFEQTAEISSQGFEVLEERASAPAYTPDFRDPFEPAASLFVRRKPRVVKTKSPKPDNSAEREAPPLELQGITGITATIHGSDGAVHFVRPGELVEGVKILKVTPTEVLAIFANKTITLKLKS